MTRRRPGAPPPRGMRGVLDVMAADLNAGRVPLQDRKRHRRAMAELREFLDMVDDE